MEVWASLVLENWTTPLPRERPFGSYWISARSTVPMVWKSSTKSSLLVLHGNCNVCQKISSATASSNCTYVLDVDDWVSLASRSDTVGEGVGRHGSLGWCRSVVASALSVGTTLLTIATASLVSTTAVATLESATTATEASKATTTKSAATASKATTKAPTKASTTAKAWSCSRKSIFTNFERAALPVVAVECVDCVLCVIRRLECDHTRALGIAILTQVNISADNVACLAEEILEILPADLVREL